MESLLFEVPVFNFIEAVEPGGPVGDTLLDIARVDEQPHSEDLFTEVPLVTKIPAGDGIFSRQHPDV